MAGGAGAAGARSPPPPSLPPVVSSLWPGCEGAGWAVDQQAFHASQNWADVLLCAGTGAWRSAALPTSWRTCRRRCRCVSGGLGWAVFYIWLQCFGCSVCRLFVCVT